MFKKILFLALAFNLISAQASKKKISVLNIPKENDALDDHLLNLIQSNNKKQLKEFIEKNKININAKDNQDLTLLHYAVINGNYESIKILANLGSDPLSRDKSGTTPLHLIARKCDNSSFELFSKIIYENIDIQNSIGYSLLMYACLSKCNKIIDFLLQNKADVHLKNIHNKSIINIINEMQESSAKQSILEIFKKYEVLSPED